MGLLIWAGIEGDKYAKTPEGRAATTQRQADEAREQMLKNAERNQLAEQQPAKVPVEHKWYEGGTLHRKTISDWRAASYSDRLATSADFVTGAASIRGKTYTSMDEVKQQTVELEHAISTVADGGNADNQKVSEVAAMLYTIQDKR